MYQKKSLIARKNGKKNFVPGNPEMKSDPGFSRRPKSAR